MQRAATALRFVGSRDLNLLTIPPYSDAQRVNNRTCWVFACIVCLVFLGLTPLAPTDSDYGVQPTRYLSLYGTLLAISLLGAYFAWGALPFCTLLGACAGASVIVSGFGLLAQVLASSLLGLLVGAFVDAARGR